MKVALYGRVSTPEQTVQPQMDKLRLWAARDHHETPVVQSDIASGRLVRRPGQEAIMQAARGHHIHAVAVVKIDRWARSMQHLAATVTELHELGVDFYALDQGLIVKKHDPTSTLILHILGACAQWEASIISERTKDGMAALKAGGKHIGRHVVGCGIVVPCPTGLHVTRGIQPAQEADPPIPGGVNKGSLDSSRTGNHGPAAKSSEGFARAQEQESASPAKTEVDTAGGKA